MNLIIHFLLKDHVNEKELREKLKLEHKLDGFEHTCDFKTNEILSRRLYFYGLTHSEISAAINILRDRSNVKFKVLRSNIGNFDFENPLKSTV